MRQLTRPDDSYTPSESLDLLSDLVRFFTREGGKEGHDIARLVRQKRLYDVVHYDVTYHECTPGPSVQQKRAVRQALALFQKLEYLDVGIDKERSARDTFEAAELLCRETNEIFRKHLRGEFFFPKAVTPVLDRARRLIARTLEGFNPSDVGSLNLRFGPGASSTVRKTDASIPRKVGSGISCSEELLPWAARLLGELPMMAQSYASQIAIECDSECESHTWSGIPIDIHLGKLSFAEKNAKTLRPVETQPVLNGMFQLGIGDELADILRSVGQDIRDQSRNQKGACEGSLHGHLATVDLKSASDTIATELVAFLLPIDVFSVLHSARVGKANVPWSRDPVRFEKFSAMGNGFTFPLETLIFWSLAHSCCKQVGVKTGELQVYGDDIVIPVDAVPLLLEVLQVVGFLPNKQKSYWSGPFRESCGADYLFGIDIRPVYCKGVLTRANLFVLHNELARKGWTDAAEWLRTFLDPSLLLFGPDGYGDGHLLGDYTLTAKNRHIGWSGFTFKTFKQVTNRDLDPPRVGLDVAPFYQMSTRKGDCGFSTRDLRNSVVRRRDADAMRLLAVSHQPEDLPPIPTVEVRNEFGFSIGVRAWPKTGFDPLVERFKKVSIYVLG